jgi:tellurite resistance protein TerC
VILPWIGFVAFVGMVLALDLGVFNREAKQPSTREALTFTALTVFLALIFAAVV